MKEIKPPKSIQEYDSWSKKKRMTYLAQIKIVNKFFDFDNDNNKIKKV